MSPAEQISVIRVELAGLQQCLICLCTDSDAMRNGDPIANRAVAFDLAALYTGIERIINLCIEPLAESDQSDLLTRAAAPVNERGDTVVSGETAAELRELMAFRDLAWDGQREALEKETLLALCQSVQTTHASFTRDIAAFIKFRSDTPSQ